MRALLRDAEVSGERRPHFFAPDAIQRRDHAGVRKPIEPDPVTDRHAPVEGLDDQQADRTDGRDVAEVDRPSVPASQHEIQDIQRWRRRV